MTGEQFNYLYPKSALGFSTLAHVRGTISASYSPKIWPALDWDVPTALRGFAGLAITQFTFILEGR